MKRLATLVILIAAACTNSSSLQQNAEGTKGKADAGIAISLEVREDCGQLDSDHYYTDTVRMEGDQLVVPLRYSGGCKPHEFTACWDGSFLESFPVQARMSLLHNSNGDSCEALAYREIRIDMSAMSQSYRAGYQSFTGDIILGLEMTGDSVTYSVSSLNAADLQASFNIAREGAYFISEGDYLPEFITGAFQGGANVDFGNIWLGLGADILKAYQDESWDEVGFDDLAFENFSAQESYEFFYGLAEFEDGLDDYYKETAAAYENVVSLMAANLRDIRVIRMGPKNSDGTLAVDQGLYFYIVVGVTVDEKLAGFWIGSVET